RRRRCHRSGCSCGRPWNHPLPSRFSTHSVTRMPAIAATRQRAPADRLPRSSYSRRTARMGMPIAIAEEGAPAENRGGEPGGPWWSFTKTVIAAAALALVRDGRLALDAPLPGRQFTLRQLLRHQAGVAEYGAIADYRAAVARDEEPWPVATLLARAEAERLR